MEKKGKRRDRRISRHGLILLLVLSCNYSISQLDSFVSPSISLQVSPFAPKLSMKMITIEVNQDEFAHFMVVGISVSCTKYTTHSKGESSVLRAMEFTSKDALSFMLEDTTLVFRNFDDSNTVREIIDIDGSENTHNACIDKILIPIEDWELDIIQNQKIKTIIFDGKELKKTVRCVKNKRIKQLVLLMKKWSNTK